MPNVPVPAAAPGLPLETRRTILAAGSASAGSGALATKEEAATASAELLRLIESHRRAEARLDDLAASVETARWRFRRSLANLDLAADGVDPGNVAASRGTLVKQLEADRRGLWISIRAGARPIRKAIEAQFDGLVSERLARFDALAEKLAAARENSGYAGAEAASQSALREEAALRRDICLFPCASLADVRVKAAFLSVFAAFLDEEEVGAVLLTFASTQMAEGVRHV